MGEGDCGGVHFSSLVHAAAQWIFELGTQPHMEGGGRRALRTS
jgi:hypothetical protein